MKVRNPTGRQVLVADQGVFVPPGPDLHPVKDTEDARFLIDAGALQSEPIAEESSAHSRRKAASNPDPEETS